jgi:hypothetical protein
LVQLVIQGSKDYRDHRVILVHKEVLDTPARKVRRVIPVHRVIPDLLVVKD